MWRLPWPLLLAFKEDELLKDLLFGKKKDLEEATRNPAALEKAGVPIELHVFEDGLHGFVQMPMLDMAGEAVTRLCAFGRRCLGT